MEPSEALSTAAQIAVVLAGFAGVVVVVHLLDAMFQFARIILLPPEA
jgi:uncharacterized membrane protein YuzA (DUF378 family)